MYHEPEPEFVPETPESVEEIVTYETADAEPEPAPYLAPITMPEPVSKNILSSDVKIVGSIEFENELFIDGKLEGEIRSEGSLTVGENAQISGNIYTKSVTVLGKVSGNITVQERCELKSRAQLMGDLKAARLTIEEGAIFEGKSEVNPNKTFSAPKAELPVGRGGKFSVEKDRAAELSIANG